MSMDPLAPPPWVPRLSEALANDLKVYLFTFPGVPGARQMVQNYFQMRPREIKNWISQYEGSIVAVSPIPLVEIREVFHQQFPELFFMVVELVPSQIDGWMPGNIWEFIRHPKQADTLLPAHSLETIQQVLRSLKDRQKRETEGK